MAWDQLRRRGIADAVIRRALARGELHEIHHGVYSIVPPSLMQSEAHLAAAILAGGDGARLCHLSAAHWAELVKEPPSEIHVAITGKRVRTDGIRWHRVTNSDVVKHNRMPLTPLHRIPLDLAPDLSEWELKRVLAELEYHHEIHPSSVPLGRGHAGAAKLRRAIADHIPQLAETKSHLERAFVMFLTSRNFELPLFNHDTGMATVDAIYPDQLVAIELDGVRGHAGERRILRDHRRDLHRRREGYTPLRYAYAQLLTAADQILIEGELDRLGVGRTSGWSRSSARVSPALPARRR